MIVGVRILMSQPIWRTIAHRAKIETRSARSNVMFFKNVRGDKFGEAVKRYKETTYSEF